MGRRLCGLEKRLDGQEVLKRRDGRLPFRMSSPFRAQAADMVHGEVLHIDLPVEVAALLSFAGHSVPAAQAV